MIAWYSFLNRLNSTSVRQVIYAKLIIENILFIYTHINIVLIYYISTVKLVKIDVFLYIRNNNMSRWPEHVYFIN